MRSAKRSTDAAGLDMKVKFMGTVHGGLTELDDAEATIAS